MRNFRIALGNLKFPSTPEQSVALVGEAIAKAAEEGVLIVCFPECYVPGYRGFGMEVQRPDAAFLERAWEAVAQAAAQARVAVILGTDRIVDTGVVATALVVDPKGTVVGFQDKVQIDPSEEAIYAHGSGRQLFHVGPVRFGIVICHRPGATQRRYAGRCNAVRKLCFTLTITSPRPVVTCRQRSLTRGTRFMKRQCSAVPRKNTCYFASVNCASDGSPSTSAVVRPDGSLLCYQPYGKEGLLIADIDLDTASGLFASRCKYAGR